MNMYSFVFHKCLPVLLTHTVWCRQHLLQSQSQKSSLPADHPGEHCGQQGHGAASTKTDKVKGAAV